MYLTRERISTADSATDIFSYFGNRFWFPLFYASRPKRSTMHAEVALALKYIENGFSLTDHRELIILLHKIKMQYDNK